MIKITVAKVAHFTGHRDAIYSLERSMYQHSIYSASADGFIAEWNTRDGGDGKLIANIGKPVYCLALDPEELKLVCGTSTGNLHSIDILQNKELRNIEAHTSGLYDLKFTGDMLVSAGGDGIVKVWNRHDLTLVRTIQVSDKSCRVIALSPDHRTMAIGTSDWTISIYDIATGNLAHRLDAHKNSVFALTFSPDGNRLLSSGRDATLKVWDVNEGFSLVHDIPSHTGQVKCITYGPDSSLVATSSMDKTIKIWDASSFELLKVIDKDRNDSHTNCINRLLWVSPTQLASCSDDRAVILWDITKGVS
jgi:WD40 repeat protein